MTLETHIIVTDELTTKYNNLLETLEIEPVNGMVFHKNNTGTEIVAIKGTIEEIKRAVSDFNMILNELRRRKIYQEEAP